MHHTHASHLRARLASKIGHSQGMRVRGLRQALLSTPRNSVLLLEDRGEKFSEFVRSVLSCVHLLGSCGVACLRPPTTARYRNALSQELAEMEEQLRDDSHRFFANLKLIVIDSLGTAFAPLIGGGSNFGYSLLVSVVQTLQVCWCTSLAPVRVYPI